MKSLDQKISCIEKAAKVLSDQAAELRDEVEQYRQQQQVRSLTPVWMNKSQLARYVGLTYRTVRRYELAGKLCFNGSGRIHRNEADRFILDNCPGRAKQVGLS